MGNVVGVPSLRAIAWRIYSTGKGACCWYCAETVGQENGPWRLDHRTPVSRGGSDEQSNLVIACRSCAERKGETPVDEFRVVEHERQLAVLSAAFKVCDDHEHQALRGRPASPQIADLHSYLKREGPKAVIFYGEHPDIEEHYRRQATLCGALDTSPTAE